MRRYLIAISLLLIGISPALSEVHEFETLSKYIFQVKRVDDKVTLHIIMKRYIGDDDCLLSISPENARALGNELLEASK